MNNYNTTLLTKNLERWNVILTEIQIQQFITYYELLLEWNSFINLTAITEYNEVIIKHFIDSISLVNACDLSKNVKVIDVGTGAGFPGIPLKIVFPNLQITLLDSLNKRVKFLNEVIQKLGLANIDTIHGRAEDIAKMELYREKYDICVSRAVANLSTLSEYCLPFVRINGCFVSYKSEKITEEMKTAKRAIELLGGKINGQKEFILPESDINRNLFIINKVKATPKKFPRKAGLPVKEPIV